MDFFVMVGTVIDKAIDKARGTQAKTAPTQTTLAEQVHEANWGGPDNQDAYSMRSVAHPYRLEVVATPRTFGNGAFGRHQAVTTTYQWKVMDSSGYIVAYGQSHKQAKAVREGNAALVKWQQG